MIPRRVASTHAETIDDEMCVYEWTRREVHALNPTAARVWQMCDGRTTVSEMADVLRAELGVAQADELVWLALGEFREKKLIEVDLTMPIDQPTVSRRALIVKLGLTAAMLPVVTSIVAPGALQAQSLSSQTFNYTGAAQTFTVPAGVTSVNVDAHGAEGGTSYLNWPGGKGGRVQATIAVTPSELLTVTVGGMGGSFFAVPPGFPGFNGGGAGGMSLSGGGGGASDVRRGGTQLVVAGGGGGSGFNSVSGGDGGNTSGADGVTASAAGSGGGGGGGTQSSGGAGGVAGTSGSAGSNGTAGNGGAGAGPDLGGGGGGGGYYGGGGGGGTGGSGLLFSGGGGGGSWYTDPAATSVTHTQGARTGNGQISLVPGDPQSHPG